MVKEKNKVSEKPSVKSEKKIKKEVSTVDNPKVARKEAILKLASYLKKHNLDPDKDWSKDPVHGKKLEKYYQIIRIAEEKVRSRQEKLIKPEVHPKVKKVTRPQNIYDYPDINGQPMSKQMKKKYRIKMRALLRANMDKSKAESKALEFANRWYNEENPQEKVNLKTKPKKEEKEEKIKVKSIKKKNLSNKKKSNI